MIELGVTSEESTALLDAFADSSHFSIKLNEKVEDIERSYILTAMQENEYNQSRAARALGIKRETLIHKLKKYKII